MKINARELTAEASYKLMTGIIVPRPIAWVTTISPRGVVNLAPFSHFTFVAPKPPMVAISVGRKAGVEKDTGRNVMANEEFVVHIADVALAIRALSAENSFLMTHQTISSLHIVKEK